MLEDFQPSLQLYMHSCGVQSVFMVLRSLARARSIAAVTCTLGTTTEARTKPRASAPYGSAAYAFVFTTTQR